MSDDWVGRTIDNKYDVISVLGEGGMGTVLRARHRILETEVAIKVLRPELRSSREVRERFRKEARAAGSLKHPGIAGVIDAGETQEGIPFLVMELLSGQTLGARLRAGRLPFAEVQRIGLELLDALSAAHAQGYIHRDLKPENVFLSGPTGVVKLLDFGIVKMISVEATASTEGAGLTSDRQVLGTFSYMSPEQLQGARNVDVRTDLWATAVILYEMITGALPYDADDYAGLLNAMLTPPRPAAELAPGVPRGLSALFDRAFLWDRRGRYTSADEMRADLARIPAAGADPAAAAPSVTTFGAPLSTAHGGPMSAAHGGPMSAAHGGPMSAAHGGPMSAAHGGPMSAAHGGPQSVAPGPPPSVHQGAGFEKPTATLHDRPTDKAARGRRGPLPGHVQRGLAALVVLGGLLLAGVLIANGAFQSEVDSETAPGTARFPEPATLGADIEDAGAGQGAAPGDDADADEGAGDGDNRYSEGASCSSGTVPYGKWCRGKCVFLGVENGCALGTCEACSALPRGRVSCRPPGAQQQACILAACESADYASCDGNDGNGCETDLRVDPKSCGQCGAACAPRRNATVSCDARKCRFECAEGFEDCDRQDANGCEASVSRDAKNCGACGNVCAAPPHAVAVCRAESCGFECAADGFKDCNRNASDGCETNVQTAENNCGQCGKVCASPQGGRGACVSGTCVKRCPRGKVLNRAGTVCETERLHLPPRDAGAPGPKPDAGAPRPTLPHIPKFP